MRRIKMALVFVLAEIATGCGASLPATLQCDLEAVRRLPDDYLQVTVFDTVELVRQLHSCRAGQDAGAP